MKLIKKYVLDLRVTSVEHLQERYVLLRLTHEERLPEMSPGQFVEVRVDGSPATFLRRPISVCYVDRSRNELWLLVAVVGDGTRRLASLAEGDLLSCVLPLGRGFTIREGGSDFHSVLLVGGGVGVAPLLYQGAMLRSEGVEPTFLLGARSAKDLLLVNEFEKFGRVLLTTEDGTAGERGFVTHHSVLEQERFDMVQCCGPTPMMKSVVRYCRQQSVACEVSLENLMACGLGACLCCVEKVRRMEDDGTVSLRNVCVCKDGPVFDMEELSWQD